MVFPLLFSPSPKNSQQHRVHRFAKTLLMQRVQALNVNQTTKMCSTMDSILLTDTLQSALPSWLLHLNCYRCCRNLSLPVHLNPWLIRHCVAHAFSLKEINFNSHPPDPIFFLNPALKNYYKILAK